MVNTSHTRSCHDGTIEFTSIDAHDGASKHNEISTCIDCLFVGPSPRGDLEILGYCLLQWSCGRPTYHVKRLYR